MNRVNEPSYEPSYPVIGLLLLGAYVLACWGEIVSTITDGINFLFPHASSASTIDSKPRAQPSTCKTRQPQEEVKQHHDNQEFKQEPTLSKRQRKRQLAAQRDYENSKEGRKGYEVKGFVIDIGHRDVFGAGNVYGVAFMDLVWTMELPAFFQVAEQEWKALLAEAERNETWRRTRNPDAFRAALANILHNRITQRLTNQQRRNNNQQQQQQYPQHGQRDHQQQRDQTKHTKPAAHVPLSGKYVGAAAEQPDLVSMSVAQLRGFIKQSGNPRLAVAASSCKDQPELLSLAQHSMQLWECKHVISCSKLPDSNTEQELLAALCVLRVQMGQGLRQPAAAARSADAADLRKRYQRLALLVHPDKAAPEHKQQACQFDEAFKVLGRAYALVSSYCAAS